MCYFLYALSRYCQDNGVCFYFYIFIMFYYINYVVVGIKDMNLYKEMKLSNQLRIELMESY